MSAATYPTMINAIKTRIIRTASLSNMSVESFLPESPRSELGYHAARSAIAGRMIPTLKRKERSYNAAYGEVSNEMRLQRRHPVRFNAGRIIPRGSFTGQS